MKKLFLLLGLYCALSVTAFSQSASEWNKQGVEHSKKFDFVKAYECFTKAIELKPDFAEAYYNRATVWFELPSDIYPKTDGCADLQKARSLGFKVKDETMKHFGCL
jgi:tetratricopeptide (TPR) repeat protein